MSYYSPQRGDYKTYGYAGDPGFLSGLWKVVKTVGKSILGIPPKVAPGVPPSFPGMGPIGAVATGMGAAYVGTRLAPREGMKRVPVMAENGCCPPGFHPSKDGSGKCVKNRSMNVTNPRALRRAARRQAGFGKMASRMGYTKKKPAARRAKTCP